MSDLDDLDADLAPPTQQDPRCGLIVAWENLPDDVTEKLWAAADNPDVSAARLYAAVKKRGWGPGRSKIEDHKAGRCPCES